MATYDSNDGKVACPVRWRAAAVTTAGLAMLAPALALAPGSHVPAVPCLRPALVPAQEASALRLLAHTVDPIGWSHGRLMAGSAGPCLVAMTRGEGGLALASRPCAESDAGQHWQWKTKWIDGEDGGRSVVLLHPQSASVLESAHDDDTLPGLRLGGFQPDNPRQRFRLAACER